jgi:hypothetical protein
VQKLVIQIEELRQEMHYLALLYGLNHPKVLEISQRLDNLLNDYMRTDSPVA